VRLRAAGECMVSSQWALTYHVAGAAAQLPLVLPWLHNAGVCTLCCLHGPV
jgi:hypothetical protein